MTLKKLPPNDGINTIPTCHSCANYSSDLKEGVSGAPSGLVETCDVRNITIKKYRPGCMLHSDFLAFLMLNTPIEYPRGCMPPIFDIYNQIQSYMDSPIREILSAYAMEGGKGLVKAEGLSGIIEIVARIFEVFIVSVIRNEIIPSIRSYNERLLQHTNAYVEQALATLRKELTEDVQDNGEIQEHGARGD